MSAARSSLQTPRAPSPSAAASSTPPDAAPTAAAAAGGVGGGGRGAASVPPPCPPPPKAKPHNWICRRRRRRRSNQPRPQPQCQTCCAATGGGGRIRRRGRRAARQYEPRGGGMVAVLRNGTSVAVQKDGERRVRLPAVVIHGLALPSFHYVPSKTHIPYFRWHRNALKPFFYVCPANAVGTGMQARAWGMAIRGKVNGTGDGRVGGAGAPRRGWIWLRAGRHAKTGGGIISWPSCGSNRNMPPCTSKTNDFYHL
jgi:hypothetical protein